MGEIITSDALATLFQVVMIDLVLAGDNAVVIALAAAGLPAQQRNRAIIGIFTATALRIVCASIATQLLQILGLLFAGGILLLWVCWKMWRELNTTPAAVAIRMLGGEKCVSTSISGHFRTHAPQEIYEPIACS